MAEQEAYQSLYTYISQIDAELKVNDEIYKRRLQYCRECDSLLNGMCRICGCFVEMRAVMKKNSCPGTNAKW